MKKLYILVIAMISVSSLFAQDHSRNNYQKDTYRNNDKQQAYSQPYKNYNDRAYTNDDRYYNGRQPQIQEKDRRAAIDLMNRDYDQRISRFRNDRSLNAYERNRRIAEAQRERQQKIGSFGKGMVTGAIVGLIAGVLLSK